MNRDLSDEEIRLLGRDDPLGSEDVSDDDLSSFAHASNRRRRSSLRSWHDAFFIRCRKLRRSRILHRLLLLRYVVYAFFAFVLFTYLFRPSYTYAPAHYKELQRRTVASNEISRGNPRNEKVFISVSLYDKKGDLAGGRWGEQLLELVDLLGHDNTFVSIYENDNGPMGAQALYDLQKRLPCPNEVVYEEVDKGDFPVVTMPDNEERLKRITYLSEIRNRSLRPLDTRGNVTYDRVLFLNDVYYEPLEALHLLFSTNQAPGGRADYVAVCALDYHFSSWKFYDLYATRDFEGYSMGVPIFPYFSSAGSGISRKDMLEQRDAVRVKSCWSGMAAFDAKYLQATTDTPSPESAQIGGYNIDPANPKPAQAPARFRAEPEIFFDACECCLLMADVIQVAKGTTDIATDTGVYVNPYVRVTYLPNMLWKVKQMARIERIFSGPHWLINKLANMPTFNEHRTVLEGQDFMEEVWKSNPELPAGGEWGFANRTGRSGMYCGVREMQIIREHGRTQESNWEQSTIPSGYKLFHGRSEE